LEKIKEEISKKKGETVFVSREFEVPGEVTGDFIPPIPRNYHHYEAGIIEGEILRIEKIKSINLGVSSQRGMGMHEITYNVFGIVSIPVERKLEGFLNDFQNSFSFNIGDLENIKKGEILIEIMDLYKLGKIPSYSSIFPREIPEFKDFNLLIGDEKIEQFLKNRGIRNPERLFITLKKPHSVKNWIDSHYYKERKELGENLAISANKIANMFREVKGLEDRVIHASFFREADQDGSIFSHWDREEVEDYFKLRDKISKNLESLKPLLEKGWKLYENESLPFIDGSIIGFPERISFNSYHSWLEHSLISDMQNTFKKIDSYLKEEREKASR
jgi:hypothetical protein